MIPGFLYGTLLAVVAVLAWLYYRTWRRLSRYQQLQDGILCPMARLELDHFRPISCSPSFASLLGYSNPAECITLFPEYAHLRGQDFEELYTLVRDRKQKVVAVEMVNRTGEIVASEIEVFIADGANFMELRLLSGQDTADMVNIRQSLLPCIETDTQLTIIASNQAARDLFGWGDTLVAGKHLGSLLFPPAYRERLESIHLRRMARKGQSRLRHLTLIGNDEYAECQWHLVLQQEAGRVFAFCIDDYRDRHISRLLLESLSDQQYFLWEMDTATRRIETDPSWLRLLGYDNTRAPTTPEFWESILDPEDREHLSESFARFMAGEEATFRVRYRLASGSGVEHRIESSAIVRTVGEDGRPRRVIGLNRDVTEGAVSTNALKHHDLANHLASVTGYAGLVSESEALPETLASYVREISRAGYKARELLQGGDSGVESARGLPDEIDSIAARFNIRVVHGIADVSCPVGSNDLRAILEPLFKNAVESGSDVDHITIETLRARIENGICSHCGVFGAADFLTLRIRDLGEGIAPDHLAWIFTAGFTTRRIGGDRETGLSAVSRKVHEHGGHLRVESGAPPGTCVSVYLPAGNRTTATTAHAEGRVMVIDDQDSVARYLQEVLGQQGYEVEAYTDANEALSTLYRDPGAFDLVITDQTMPGISGDVVMRSIHELRPDLPVILCTGYSEKIGERTARELGACGYLAKPVDTDRLLGLIHESLQP